MTGLENVASIFLAVGVGLTAAMIINIGHYTDLCMFLFCAVTASCQYSLLKSVQPDSASPTHGFNRIIVYRYVLRKVVIGCVICSGHNQDRNPRAWIFPFWSKTDMDSVKQNLCLALD